MTEIRRPFGVSVVCALLTMFLQGCANVQMEEQEFRPGPICEAIVSGNTDRAMQLVRQGEDVNAGFGCALFAAAQRGQLELATLLLDHKADPNRRISGELTAYMGASTPLVSAVTSRKVEMVRLLLERGADPRNDLEAFQIVLNFNNAEMAGLLLDHGANANMATPAERPVYANPPNSQQQIEVPRRDLQPDRIDETARRLQCSMSTLDGSLLYLAAKAGPEIAKLLIDRGADPNYRTLNGATPLMNATFYQNHQVMTLLMDAGADVEARDRCGRTVADYASLYPWQRPRAQQTKALLQERRRK